MPTVIITDMSPTELFARAVDNARRATAEIDRLFLTAFEPGETREDRALKVAAHARVLAEAFAIIDSISLAAADELQPACDCPVCSPRPEREPDAPVPPHMN